MSKIETKNPNPKLRRNGGGGTGVGNFLRSINFKDVGLVVGSLAAGNVKSAMDIILDSTELSSSEVELAILKLEQDTIEMQEVTKRLGMDNEHTITRLVRPVVYAAMFVMFLACVFLDGNIGDFTIDKAYIPVIQSLFSMMTVFYYGSRGIEKVMKEYKK